MSEDVNVLDLLANASETGFEEITLVEPAKYKLELDANPTKNGIGVFVKGRVLEGPFQGKLTACGSLTFNEKASGIALQNLKGMGITKDDCNAIAAVNPGSLKHLTETLAKWIKGRVVEAALIYNDYNNEIRNQFEIGKIMLISAPANPGFGAGIPQAAPAPAAQAAAPAPAPAPAEVVPPTTAAPAAATPAPAPQPVAVVAQPQPVAAGAVASSPDVDPGF